MRILFASVVLLATASCAAPSPPPQQGANCAAARKELAAIARAKARASDPPADAMSPAQPAPPAPAPGAAAAPPPVAAVADRPWFPFTLPLFRSAPPAGRLTLSNFGVGLAHVQAFVTSSSACAFHPGVVPLDRKLPLNATWTIPTPPGTDVCWRRLSPAEPSQVARDLTSPAPPPAEWNRAYTASGRFIDARL
jgi:hypothetical protein